MGRLRPPTGAAGGTRSVHYRKLVDEFGTSKDILDFVPALPDYVSYCCCHCGRTQKLQAEELKSLVGHAWRRMAFATQRPPASSLQDVIAHVPSAGSAAPLKKTTKRRPYAALQPPPLPPPNARPWRVCNVSRQNFPSSDESNSPTELNSFKRLSDKPPLIKLLAMGLTGGSVLSGDDRRGGGDDDDDSLPLVGPSDALSDISVLKVKASSQLSISSSEDGTVPSPPPLPPERSHSLGDRWEEGELRRAPWFQAGIPREITLEVLGQEPVGAFMVRESTSKPGCYALSLRVPRDFQPTGIAHYLIMRTNKGFKIKGFTKEFSTLTALITHHSVMPELLPCTLSLNRYKPTYIKTDSSSDFADINSDPDYNTLADFRKMMADLNV